MQNTRVSKRQFLTGAATVTAGALLPSGRVHAAGKKVLVIGAGLSGLYSASLLEEKGFQVTVLEGRDRIGGRLCTLDDVPGRPEAGGQTIGPLYGRTRHLVRKFGLEMQSGYFSAATEPVRQIMNIGGERILPADWSVSPANPFPEAMKSADPDRLFMQLVGKGPFLEFDEWLNANNQHLDRSVADLFREKGINEEGIRLLGVNSNYGRNLDEISLLFMMRTFQILFAGMSTPGGMKTVVGGNQRLPEVMAAALNNPVQLNKVVTNIDAEGSGYRVRSSDGTSYVADHVVVSVPLPAMKNVSVTPGLPDVYTQAVTEIPYGPVVQAHFSIENEFWAGEGFMPNVWSDSPIERVFSSDPEGTGRITNLTAWINGEGVDRVVGMSESQLEAFFADELVKLLPESKGSVKLSRTFSWQDSPLSGGSFAHWRPGQIAKYGRAVGQRVGNLHFAGEHTAVWMSGMEGALESGERVAQEIIQG